MTIRRSERQLLAFQSKLVSDIYHGDLIITCLCVRQRLGPISDFFAPLADQPSQGRRRWRGRRGGGDRSCVPGEPGPPVPGDGWTAEG